MYSLKKESTSREKIRYAWLFMQYDITHHLCNTCDGVNRHGSTITLSQRLDADFKNWNLNIKFSIIVHRHLLFKLDHYFNAV